ncbi:MAG TPA: methylated-DNA--[protein]-cysteine S-methyltransferase [Usitatibacter sp.]|jgi:methylated-DNA-[protein]-cysteine S-methyltransferase|nr:methylated-DNA--[protein]-cysteine S-methyltransferase [Usitatibacter sp.]
MIYARFSTPLGNAYVTLHGDALAGLYFEGARHAPAIASDWERDDGHPAAKACAQQLAEYFAGTRDSFDLPLAPRGTPFQQRVWAEIARVPFGATITYAQLAARAGAPEAMRAAGAATGRNPLTILVPCHRIVGSDGALTGYAGGLERKRRLLELEGALQPALV